MSDEKKRDRADTFVSDDDPTGRHKYLQDLAQFNLETEERETPTPSNSDGRDGSSADTPAGEIVTDAEGNRVWKWISDSLGSTSRFLQRLDLDDLSLEETRVSPGIKAPVEGSNPYDTSDNVKPRRCR